MMFYLSSDASDHLPDTDHRDKNMWKGEPKKEREYLPSILLILLEGRLWERAFKEEAPSSPRAHIYQMEINWLCLS